MKVVVYVEGGGDVVAQRRTLRNLWEQPRAPFCRRRQNGRTDKDAQIKSRSIIVKGTEVSIASRHEQDYIALTDMVKNFDGGGALIEQWRKTRIPCCPRGVGAAQQPRF